LSGTLTELNKLMESEGKQVAVAPSEKPFPELNGSELRVYVPSWEETSQYRPLSEIQVSAKNCEGPSLSKLKSLTSLGREANACLLKGRHSQLEAVALRLSDLHPDTPWGPFYLALSTSSQKATERALWYLKLAQQRSSESILFYEEGRAAYALLPDSGFAAKLQKLEGPWAETEELRFLSGIEKIKLKECESAREEVQQLRSQYWRGTPVDRLMDQRCPNPNTTTVSKVDL
jgi:hypothetical protein